MSKSTASMTGASIGIVREFEPKFTHEHHDAFLVARKAEVFTARSRP